MSGPLPRETSAATSRPASPDDPTSIRPSDARPGAHHADPTELEPGARIGRFELTEQVGRGGMGVVFLAYDPVLARDVAIKILRPQRAAVVDERRLVREAQALAQLQHPNVVAVHDVGVEAGLTYLAMDFVRGQTLRGWLRSEEPGLERIAAVMADAGDGIAAAHSVGLLHRDIKPANLLVADDGRVVVADFGLARAAHTMPEADRPRDSDRLLEAEVTQGDALVGTPRYMAPELLANTGPPSHASDQFAFAVTLFEAVFGYPPFAGSTPRELLAAMQRPLAPLDSQTLEPVRKVLERGLAPDPAARFPAMADLVGTLRLAVGHRERAIGRRRMIVALGGAGAVAVGGAGLAFAALSAPAPEPSEVQRLEQEAVEAAARARYVYPSPDDPDETTALLAVLELERLGGEAADDASSRLRHDFAATLSGLGDRYWSVPDARGFALDFYVQALVFDPATDVASVRAGLTRGQRLAMTKRAEQGEFTRGELIAAEPLIALANDDAEVGTALREVVSARRGERPATHDDTLARLANRLDPARVPEPAPVNTPPTPQATPEAPPPDAREADGPETAAPEDDKAGAKRLTAQGRQALGVRDYARAEAAFRKALAAAPRHGPALIGLSDVSFERSEYGRAVHYAKKAVSARPRAGGYRIKLGDAYLKVDRYRDADQAYRKALELGRSDAEARLAKVAKYLQ